MRSKLTYIPSSTRYVLSSTVDLRTRVGRYSISGEPIHKSWTREKTALSRKFTIQVVILPSAALAPIMLAVHILNVGEPSGSSTQCAQIYRTNRNIGHRLQNFWKYVVVSAFLVGLSSTLVEGLRCVDHSTHLSYWLWKYSLLVTSWEGQNGMSTLWSKRNRNRRIRITEKGKKEKQEEKAEKYYKCVYGKRWKVFF